MGLFSDHKAKTEGSCGGHSCHCGHGNAGSGDTATTVKDPVCGMTIDPATAAATREHEGITYYFCNPGCADKFDQDAARYIA